MNIVSARRFGLWTKLFRKWMKRELDTFSSVINASATKNKQEILEAISAEEIVMATKAEETEALADLLDDLDDLD